MTSLTDLDGLTARDVIHRRLSTTPADATVAQLRSYFEESTSRQVAVLVEDGRYVGAVTPADLPPSGSDEARAADYATPRPTLAPDAPAAQARDLALAEDSRRLPIVEADGTLVGVVAINRDRDGFCGA